MNDRECKTSNEAVYHSMEQILWDTGANTPNAFYFSTSYTSVSQSCVTFRKLRNFQKSHLHIAVTTVMNHGRIRSCRFEKKIRRFSALPMNVTRKIFWLKFWLIILIIQTRFKLRQYNCAERYHPIYVQNIGIFPRAVLS